MSSKEVNQIKNDLFLLQDATHCSVVDLEKKISSLSEEVFKLNTRIKVMESNNFMIQKYIQQSIQKDEKTIIASHDN